MVVAYFTKPEVSDTHAVLVITDFCLVVSIRECFPLRDIPENVTIEAHGRGARMPMHPSDAILLLKRYASDDLLSQDSQTFNMDQHRFCLKVLAWSQLSDVRKV